MSEDKCEKKSPFIMAAEHVERQAKFARQQFESLIGAGFSNEMVCLHRDIAETWEKIGALLRDADDMRISFDLRWKADMRAIDRWQEATGQTLVWPDHADLCVWLLDKLWEKTAESVAGYGDITQSPEKQAAIEPWVVSYKNYRGEVSLRRIIPKSVRFGTTEWHPEPGWLLLAFDLDKQEDREFAMADFNTPTIWSV